MHQQCHPAAWAGWVAWAECTKARRRREPRREASSSYRPQSPHRLCKEADHRVRLFFCAFLRAPTASTRVPPMSACGDWMTTGSEKLIEG